MNRKRFAGHFVIFFAARLILIPPVCHVALASGSIMNVAQIGNSQAIAFSISSSSFLNGGDIPKKFTCEGSDVSPDLRWAGTPPGTQILALIADDPDAPVGTWTHWVLFDLPVETITLPEGMAKVEEIPGGGRQGSNDFRKIGYGGPCPPVGKPHRYFFKLYALNTKLNLRAGANKTDVEDAMKGHILARAEIMGKYKR